MRGFDITYTIFVTTPLFAGSASSKSTMHFPFWASELTTVKVSFYSFLLLFHLLTPIYVTATIHDDSFMPDAILRVTTQNISLGGIEKLTTLINGSVPGPELRVPENETAWIRVFNDMEDRNLTMVS